MSGAVGPSADVPGSDPAAARALVDHAAVARRLRRWLALLVAAVPTVWLVAGALSGGPRLGSLVELAVAAVVVGGAAARGALRAGARGERLAAGDVALLPPQLRRRGVR